jgi:FAD/FMN-containing dehydrogenase
LLPNLDVVECSPTKNSELFYAALGGMGLLGVVLEVEIELMKVQSSFMVVDFVRTKDLDETLRTFHERDERYQYSVGWIDCVASGASFGRGVLMFGRHAGLQDLPARLHENPFGAMPKGHITVPEGVPDFLLNPLTLRAFNALYYRIHPTKEGALVPLFKFFYPLDSVHEWNRFYGKQGFVQWQCVLPYEDGAKNIRFVLETLQRYRCFPYLSVLKRLGNPSGGLLSFPMPGYTLALDFPIRQGLFPVLDALDKMVVESGGRLYLAKDARMSKETFRATYPSWRRFAEIKRALDRTLKLESGLSMRLGLSEAQ